MPAPKGQRNISGMQGRRKGGLREKLNDGFDRSSPFTLASLADEWLQHMEERNLLQADLIGYALGFKNVPGLGSRTFYHRSEHDHQSNA